ncbi:MAG: RES family NAD+ phosphorylase [Pseudomonadota bacterium]|nr:RES family NAD+ phosphorylase [Pseudomonadota bacterium]
MPRSKPLPPPGKSGAPREPRGILELDRFSEASLQQWKTLSEDLDELERTLYYALEPERRRLWPDLLAALQQQVETSLEIHNWFRIATYSHSLNPLSAGGSLLAYGGRFNPGADLERGTLPPWPALYLAEDFETAFHEKFQMGSDERRDGLSAADLALHPNVSHVTVRLDGRLARVFDATSPEKLDPVARVLGRIKLPERAGKLKRKLQIQQNALYMIRTGKQLFEVIFSHNWRRLPVQFDLPAPSQVLAEMIRDAGYEGILYPSTRHSGRCLVVFPGVLREGSFIALVDKPPHPETVDRLDASTADTLAGWEVLPVQMRNRQR